MNKTVGRMAETAGSVTGDESLQAEGRALGRTAYREIFGVVAQPGGGWVVEKRKSGQVSSVHRTKDGTVQTKRTYG